MCLNVLSDVGDMCLNELNVLSDVGDMCLNVLSDVDSWIFCPVRYYC